MRKFCVIFLSVISISSYCQHGQLIGHINKTDSDLIFQYVTIRLEQNGKTIHGTVPDSSGSFGFNKIPKGKYSLGISQLGFINYVTDSLRISKDTIINLNIAYPPPCMYIYVKGQKPKCIGGHTDHIIPIVYGIPTLKTLDRAKKGEVFLGGCMVSDCDPNYYCLIHKKKL